MSRAHPPALRIHLVNPMRASAGSEWRACELYKLLSPHAEVRLWSAERPDPAMAALLPIEPIEPGRIHFPRGGTLVFVGVYYRYGRWVHLSGASRRIIIYNSHHPHLLRRRVRKLGSFGTHRVEVAFASRWLKRESGFEGTLEPSLVNLARFAPRPTARLKGPFIVGRLSRNQPEKHHAADPALYRRLAERGFLVRVMGGDVLRTQAPLDPRVELLPEGGMEAATFLQGLDCFFYRTSQAWQEPHGRVVQEAMACGLPVVCGRSGGMAEYIDHGRNGFLFDDEEDALRLLLRLRDDPSLRARVGATARRDMEAAFSQESRERLLDFYLKGAPSFEPTDTGETSPGGGCPVGGPFCAPGPPPL